MSDYIVDFPVGATNRVSKVTRLGSVVRITDQNYAAVGVKPLYSGMSTLARVVKNGSGGTLAAGAACYWDIAGEGPGKEVDGIASVSSNHIPAGFVDPFVAAAIPDTETFLLWFYGPCQMLSTTGTAVVNGNPLTLGASGRVDVYDVTSPEVADTFHYCGRALAAVASGTASGTLFRAFADTRF
jgi:hypothetical protein